MKMWILIIASATTVGFIFFNLKAEFRIRKLAYIPIFAFFAALTISAIFSPNKYQAIFGAQARATGWITYACLILIVLSVSLAASKDQIRYLDRVVLITGTIVTAYGFLQHFGADPIHWNNPYNPVIATLGNPDFSAALFAFVGIMNFGIGIKNFRFNRIQAFLHFAVFAASFLAILFTAVRQGLIALAIGVAILSLVFLYSVSNLFGYLGSTFTSILGILGILGILNHGPLSSLLYKESVSLRGDYWRVAVRMLRHHLLTGVGLDSYGDYFRQYRDLTQVLRHGPNVVSNSAHNVVLQLAATGGIFVLTTYVGFIGVITFLGARTLKRNLKRPNWVAASVIATWVAYLVQSLISIDNIGLSIWGWFTAGMIIYFAYSETETQKTSQGTPQQIQKNRSQKPELAKNEIGVILINATFGILAILIVVPMYLSSSAMYRVQTFKAPTKDQISAYQSYLGKPTSYGLVNPYFQLREAVLETEYINQQSGITKIENIVKNAPWNSAFDAINVAANYYEQTGNRAKAEEFLQQLVKLDKLDTGIYLRLLNVYKLNGQIGLARNMFTKIQEIDPRGPDMAAARKAMS